MATFTWTVTAAGVSAWETTASWAGSNPVHPTLASFTTSPGDDYVINSGNLFTIDEIGAGGSASPDIANSLTLTGPLTLSGSLAGNPQAHPVLLMHDDHGALDVTTTLGLDGLMNLGTIADSVLSMGGAADGGTINLGVFGRLEGSAGDSVQDIGTSATELLGAGTVIAQGGVFTIGTSVQVPAGTSLQFQINSAATLAFADMVGSGTIVFTAAPNTVLDVAALSTFNASVSKLSVGTTVNTPVNYIDFLNVGTNASATLTGITTTGATLTVFTNGGSHTIPILGNYTGKNANVNYVSDGNGGTNIFITNVPCYAAGTAILTPDGEVAVESLQAGDVVMTSEDGRLTPRAVIWAGYREIDLIRHPKPETAAPVRFREGALGPGRPHRELVLSPDHCLFIEGGLVPAKLLVNGMTIVRDLSVASIRYHHIELERHGLLLAEGVEAESYLDTGNRAYFGNAGLATILYPEFGINEHLRCWETDARAPLLTRPHAVRPIWERFAARAMALGFTEPVHATTTDPALRLLVDGRRVRPITTTGEGAGRTVRFVVPDGAASVRLVSRRAAPADTRPWLDDPRLLGVAVQTITLRDRTGETVVGADHPALTEGWHAVEYAANGTPWRWTAGEAVLPIMSNGPCVLEITLVTAPSYPDEPGFSGSSRLAA